MCRTRWFSGVVISSNPLKEVGPIVCKKNIYIYLNVSDYVKWGLNLIFSVVWKHTSNMEKTSKKVNMSHG